MQAVLDQNKLEELLGRVVHDLAAGESGVSTYVGDTLGLYRAMDGAGPLTAGELAAMTATHERYVREWLQNQAIGGYVVFDPATDRFELPPEQAAVFADETSPAFLAGVIEITAAMWASADRVVEAFQTGRGIDYADHDPRLARGISRSFAPLYRSALVSQWIPAIAGLEERLETGTRVLDVGCGTGISTVLLAEAFPNSEFVGYDLHEEAIELARKGAADAGLGDRVRFEVAHADAPPAGEYGLVCFFDALHDIGDPEQTVAVIASQLAGVVMVVEPAAADRLEANMNPVSRLYSAGSVALCTPSALAHGDHALGAQAGPEALRRVLEAGGLRDVKVAATTPFNLIIEAHA